MNQITILSLGAEPAEENLTLASVKVLKTAETIVLKTERCSISEWLKNEGLKYQSLDNLYETSQDFDELNQSVVDTLIQKAQSSSVCFCVLDANTDESVNLLIKTYKNIRVLPSVSQGSNYIARAGVSGQYIVSTASSLSVHEAQFPMCISEIDNPLLASDCKLKLLPYYGEDAKTVFFENENAETKIIKLIELDRQKFYSHSSFAVVFPHEILKKTRFDMEDLMQLMRILRSPEGCPWDRKQTHKSLRKFLVEEAYEAALAIDEEDDAHMQEELGDVLLQIALHSVVGEEYGTTSFSDIATDISKKMIERHPHIFAEKKEYLSAEEVKFSWEKAKQKKRGIELVSDAMKEVKRGMPPLLRAEKIQKLAASVGFDWDKPEEALQKVNEEAEEVQEELKNNRDPSEEIGDLLFSCVNVSRLCGLDAEKLLNMAAEKFIRRFVCMEKELNSVGKPLQSLTSQEMCVYWERSKAKAD
ncbi:MAG: nucleoside triphosphate pyrophosphohydrolase [Eubacteriales bacterium]|nr:nucleoside triphosphate pyrophosphohydrolase [Eubacteriales bacterium]